MTVAGHCCRNVKEESLEFEQVQELFEVRPKEHASYAADWGANRQRALALISHIVDSALPRKPLSVLLSDADSRRCWVAVLAGPVFLLKHASLRRTSESVALAA